MTAERSSSHDQRSAAHLRNLDHRDSVLAGIEKAGGAKRRIVETFGDRPDLAIVWLGVDKGLSQRRIADELGARGLQGATQTSVYRSIAALDDAWFLRKPPKGPHVVRPGWEEEFNIKRELRRILKKHRVEPL